MRSPEFSNNQQEMGDVFLKAAHEKAVKVLDMNCVEIDDFDEFYPDAKLAADKEYVKVRKQMYAVPSSEMSRGEVERSEKAKKMSELMEAIIVDPKVIRSWYGITDESGFSICDVNAMGTSELDDLANGVDAVWELKHSIEGYSNVALGVDVTFASGFEEKFQYIKGDIDRGQLAKIEYFMPKWGDMKGQVTQIPRAIIGADAQHLTDIALPWTNIEERRKDIEEHPMQRLILEEINLQLPIYEAYARSVGQDEIANKIGISHKKFGKLYELSKNKIQGFIDFIENDHVFQHMKYYLRNFNDIKSKVSTGQLRAGINAKHGI